MLTNTTLRIAYFINQYPKPSHSFIRREIRALEREGIKIDRIALRGWNERLVDKSDMEERTFTRYLLQGGALALLRDLIWAFLVIPRRFFFALAMAMRMAGPGAQRPWYYHVAYLAEACRALRWLRKSKVAHVHAHFGTNAAEVVMLINALGGPSYSFTIHRPRNECFRGINEKVHRAAFVVAICSYVRSQLYLDIDSVDWPKINVVHCGLETGFYDVEPEPVPVAPRLVCVGRLTPQKAQLLLVEASSILAKRNIPFELVLAGDGEMRADVERLITKYRLGSKVKITGWVDSTRIRTEILASRALVLPSLDEGLPVAIMEAMALRRPILSTYVAGIPELVVPGKNGWLVPAGSVEELATAMETVLRTPLEELRRMGEAAHQRVVERHSIDCEGRKLADLFRRSSGQDA